MIILGMKHLFEVPNKPLTLYNISLDEAFVWGPEQTINTE